MDDIETLTVGLVRLTFPVARNDNRSRLNDDVAQLIQKAADNLREAAADCAAHNGARAQRFVATARALDEMRRRHG
jgi:hypothetical protein